MPLVAALMVISACQKEVSFDNDPNQIGNPKLPPTPITGSVAGMVVDENNTPVQNAEVRIGTHTLTTDSRGIFNSGNITLDKFITTVKVEMNGYHTAYRSFSANETKNYVSIKLIPKTLAGTFASDAAGLVNLPNGSSLSFQANSMVLKGTTTPYSGTVNVYATYIDPTANDFGSTVPGSLMAEDATRFYVLRSTGMLAVEMEGAGGEPLQLATGKPASVKLAIPASLTGAAPSTIDTWSLDGRGIWMKEGTATRVGNAYEFEATHFSFWNCDVPTTSVYLNINVKDNNGNNMPNQLVSLTSSTTFGTSWGVTDSLGNVSGLIPANESLTLKVFGSTYNCGAPYHTQNIGPYSSASSVNVVVTPPASTTYTVSGLVNDCSGNPVASGSVSIYVGMYSFQYVTVNNGTFTASFTQCNPVTTITVIASDHNGNQQGTAVSVPVTGNSIDAGTLVACGTSTNEFIEYVVDGTTYSITNATPGNSLTAVSNPTATFIGCYTQNGSNDRISFQIMGGAVGTFQVGTSDSLLVNAIPSPQALTTSTATITSYGAVGQYIEGNFNIPFTSAGNTHTLTGGFRVKRIQ